MYMYIYVKRTVSLVSCVTNNYSNSTRYGLDDSEYEIRMFKSERPIFTADYFNHTKAQIMSIQYMRDIDFKFLIINDLKVRYMSF